MISGLGRSLLHPWRMRAFAVAAAALAWLAIVLLAPAALHQADERATDLVWQLSADTQAERRVVVVDIDDASLQRIGPWPWPRETQARLVNALRDQGAALQLYDIVFPDARQGTGELAAALAAADATSPAVLAQVFALNRESTQAAGQLAGALPGDACLPPAAPATGYVANVSGLGNRAGHITPRLDPDGAVRRVPALVCYGGRNYPTLALGRAAGARRRQPACLAARRARPPAVGSGVDAHPGRHARHQGAAGCEWRLAGALSQGAQCDRLGLGRGRPGRPPGTGQPAARRLGAGRRLGVRAGRHGADGAGRGRERCRSPRAIAHGPVGRRDSGDAPFGQFPAGRVVRSRPRSPCWH